MLRAPPPSNILNSPGFVWGILCCLPLVALAWFQPWFPRDEMLTPAPPVSLAARSNQTASPPAAGLSIPQSLGYIGFDPPTVDLGSHFWGAVVPFELTFVNRSGEPVTIAQTKPSCGCTVLSDDHVGEIVSPGDSLMFALSMDMQKIAGPKVRTVDLMLKDGPTCRARLTVDVLPTWELEPDTIDFGDVDVDEPAEVARLVVLHTQSTKLMGTPKADAPWVRCQQAHRDKEPREILVRVLKDRLPPGVSSTSVTVRTTDSTVPAKVIYITARGMHALTADPSHLFLRGTRAQSTRFVVTSNGRPARLLSVESESDAIVATISAQGVVEVRNESGAALSETFVIRVTDHHGRCGKCWVSTFD